MDTSSKIDEDLLGLKFTDLQGGSLLNELEEISEPYNEPSSTSMPPHNVFAGKPCKCYMSTVSMVLSCDSMVLSCDSVVLSCDSTVLSCDSVVLSCVSMVHSCVSMVHSCGSLSAV